MLKISTESKGIVNAYSAKEVAERLDIHPVTVYRWVSAGKLLPIRIGRRVYFSLSAMRNAIR